MASFNRVVLMGNLTRDVELKYTQGGTAVTELGLAVNDRRKNADGEWIDETTFVDVTLWGRTAEVASEYLSKGSPILVEGRLKLHTWETDGQKRSKLRVVGERMQMLGGRTGGAAGGTRPHGSGYQQAGGEQAGGQQAGGQQGPPADQQNRYSEPVRSSAPTNDAGSPGSGGPPEDEIPF